MKQLTHSKSSYHSHIAKLYSGLLPNILISLLIVLFISLIDKKLSANISKDYSSTPIFVILTLNFVSLLILVNGVTLSLRFNSIKW